MDLNLKGKRVLVTGASKGIGRACVEILEKEGCTVLGASRSIAAGPQVKAVDLAKRRPIIARASYHNGKRDVPTVQVDIIAVEQGNMRETVVKDGFHKDGASTAFILTAVSYCAAKVYC